MRYAIVSDIHSNYQAWNAVYQDILQVGVDEIICLGDIVGYGADPVRVLDSVFANVHHVVLGNHDAAVAGKMRTQRFSQESRKIIEWSRSQLSDKQLGYLRDLPLLVGGNNFLCAHADPAAPATFRYIYQPADAQRCWEACQEQLIFIGHTHIPGIHMVGKMGASHYLPPQELRCNREMRYVVNVGSVGQPRDGNLNACYCLYESDKHRIIFRRVAYDLTHYLRALREQGLMPHPCMLEGKLANPQAQLRSMEFRPLEEVDKDDAPVQERKANWLPDGHADNGLNKSAPGDSDSEADGVMQAGQGATNKHRRSSPAMTRKIRGRHHHATVRSRNKRAAYGRGGTSRLTILIFFGVLAAALLALLIILAVNSSG